ncbi:hypothetical protein KSS87_018345 [Heliosperma pusillum]|nr:hypothetical protein KSS87_018345 [Heliosperma pusillum]
MHHLYLISPFTDFVPECKHLPSHYCQKSEVVEVGPVGCFCGRAVGMVSVVGVDVNGEWWTGGCWWVGSGEGGQRSSRPFSRMMQQDLSVFCRYVKS